MTPENFPLAATKMPPSRAVDYWNARYPDGTNLHYWDGQRWLYSRTTSPAVRAERGHAAVEVDGVDGALPLAQLHPAPDWKAGAGNGRAEVFAAAAATAEAQDRCDAWNRAHPNGTLVRRKGCEGLPTHTTSPAMVIGRTASIHVAFLRDPIALADVRPVTSEEVSR